ncbi:PhoH family protein [Thermodesulfobacteriota bacterium]
MKKNYVLDTNVLLHDPQSINKFADNNIIIPITVIEEIDRFKKDLNEIGRNARFISRELDELRSKGNLSEGVELENGGVVKVMLHDDNEKKQLPAELMGDKADNIIMAVAIALCKNDKENKTVFVTKDTNLRIKADALGLPTEDYESNKVDIKDLYSGYVRIDSTGEAIGKLRNDATLDAGEVELFPNQCVELVDSANDANTALARYNKTENKYMLVKDLDDTVWGISPRNKEQRFAFDLLLDDNIKLVTLTGKAGTGKTLLAIAAGLLKSSDENIYKKLLVSRPIFPMGRDLGFLPGDIKDKLKPWMQPIFDNIELLFQSYSPDGKKPQSKAYEELMALGLLELEPLTYIRGRSIPNQFIIVDESQNLTPHEIKTIITRVGDNTKIVLTGDPYQIDNPYIDASSNGLSYVVEHFKDDDISGHISLMSGERSDLAERAANRL